VPGRRDQSLWGVVSRHQVGTRQCAAMTVISCPEASYLYTSHYPGVLKRDRSNLRREMDVIIAKITPVTGASGHTAVGHCKALV